ncbi:MAG TPA: hypothetical protein VNG51_18575 [Ktedonobacteraceae bacterium]|nr:hypothetical protein [Ktedonobacteraceae bacterium]
MFRPHSIFAILVFCLVASVAIVSPAMASVASAQACGTWHIVPSPNPEVISALEGVTALSKQDIWTVGGHNDFNNTHHLTLAENWNGTKWSVSPTVDKSTETELLAVSAVSANDVWAVGTYQKGNVPGKSLTEHWNGASWQVIPSPNVAGKDNWLVAVAAHAPNDVWAVGYSEVNLGNYQTLTEHWNGTNWSIIPSINVGSVGDIFSSVVDVSAKDVWAVGDATVNFSASQTLVEHWNGVKWKVVSSPSVPSLENQLSGVSALSAQDIWTVGSATDNTSGAVETLVEHWDGTQWSIVSSPNPPGQQVPIDGLQSVATVSANDVWAVGYHQNAKGMLRTLTEHWNGTKWVTVTSPNRGTGENQLKGIVSVPGTNKVVAVGYSYAPDFSYTHTLIMTMC